MKHLLALAIAATTLTACGALPAALTGVGTGTTRVSTAADAAAFGGLADTLAAHVSVQLGTPAAYALSTQSKPYLAALGRVMDPMRRTLADRLAADATVTQGLASWERSTATAQLNVLKRIAAIEADVMACDEPSIVARTGASGQTGLMAYYQPAASGVGEIVIYTDAVAKGGKYMAVSTLVHEMRHAAQDQLVQANTRLMSGLDADQKTLASAYSAAWQAMNAQGGESSLAYGDYTHLNVEYDAFQTGNMVASILSKGAFDDNGFGFVDTHYSATGTADLDLEALADANTGANLVAAVNKAEYQAERSHTGTVSPVRGPRSFPGGFLR
jgi:hypothetical protein